MNWNKLLALWMAVILGMLFMMFYVVSQSSCIGRGCIYVYGLGKYFPVWW